MSTNVLQFPICVLEDADLNKIQDAAMELRAGEVLMETLEKEEDAASDGRNYSDAYLDAEAASSKVYDHFIEVVDTSSVLLLIEEVKAWRAGLMPAEMKCLVCGEENEPLVPVCRGCALGE